jgi:hypothetical protein
VLANNDQQMRNVLVEVEPRHFCHSLCLEAILLKIATSYFLPSDTGLTSYSYERAFLEVPDNFEECLTFSPVHNHLGDFGDGMAIGTYA